jgi:hypothetical protein
MDGADHIYCALAVLRKPDHEMAREYFSLLSDLPKHLRPRFFGNLLEDRHANLVDFAPQNLDTFIDFFVNGVPSKSDPASRDLEIYCFTSKKAHAKWVSHGYMLYGGHFGGYLPQFSCYISDGLIEGASDRSELVNEIKSYLIQLCELGQVYYGYGCIGEEYDSYRQPKKSEPGIDWELPKGLLHIFWFNAFGPQYVNLIGREKFETLPCHQLFWLRNGGCVVIAYADPINWQKYDGEKWRIRKHLGEEYFIDVNNPQLQRKVPPNIPFLEAHPNSYKYKEEDIKTVAEWLFGSEEQEIEEAFYNRPEYIKLALNKLGIRYKDSISGLYEVFDVRHFSKINKYLLTLHKEYVRQGSKMDLLTEETKKILVGLGFFVGETLLKMWSGQWVLSEIRRGNRISHNLELEVDVPGIGKQTVSPLGAVMGVFLEGWEQRSIMEWFKMIQSGVWKQIESFVDKLRAEEGKKG